MVTAWRKVLNEVLGVILIAATVLVGLSLISHNSADPSFNSYLTKASEVRNYAGIIGASIADIMAQGTGAGAWLFICALLYLGIAFLSGARLFTIFMFLAGFTLMVASISGMAHIHWIKDPLFAGVTAGGMAGRFVAEKAMVPWFSTYGSYIILFALTLSSVLLMTRMSISQASWGVLKVAWRTRGWSIALGRLLWGWVLALKGLSLPLFLESEEERSINEKKNKIRQHEEVSPNEEPIFIPSTPDIVDFDMDESQPPLPKGREIADSDNQEDPFQQEFLRFPKSDKDYEFPALKLLDAPPKVVVRQSNEDLVKSSRILEKKLFDFGIEGRVTQVSPGPSITIFEFEPAPGVKVSRIVGLADDLAMSLRAMSIRILAPVPGKSVVGIEVPNAKREAVYLKEILSSEEYQNDEARIPLALGRDVSGKPLMVDLSEVPHLLIAGATGSGKSVGINAMILSILYNSSPDEVKFIMIDPKMLELSIYDGIPHLISPVVTHPKKAAYALKWAVTEMERRYSLLSEQGTRNIEGYNNMVEERLRQLSKKGKIKKRLQEELGEESGDTLTEKLPYIVVVIDELADLMMVSSKDVEDSLTRLAQMARAAGIHLIVATQRPSVDVLTGLIKANFPARVSFQVRSRVDSRTIIDSMGAEKLLGKGDMLYLPSGASKMQRVQGPFVSDTEIHRIVGFLKKQDKPVYNEEIMNIDIDENFDETDEELDEYYDQAIDLVARTGQASISMIQRRLRIGYNRAARIVEMMEKHGLVGPSDGSKPREVYARATEEY